MMKTHYLLFCATFFFSNNFAQVGINTQNPQATLDVNGNFRVNSVEEITALDNNHKVLLINETTKIVDKVDFSLFSGNSGLTINTSISKSVETDGISLLNIGFFDSWQKIDFNSGHVPINNGNYFDPATDQYTVPSNGIYSVSYYFRYGTGLQASLLGGTPKIGILRIPFDGSPYQVLDSRKFSGVNVGLLAVTVCTVEINSVYRLTQGDKLSFELDQAGVSLGLLSSSSTSFHIYKISD